MYHVVHMELYLDFSRVNAASLTPKPLNSSLAICLFVSFPGYLSPQLFYKYCLYLYLHIPTPYSSIEQPG